MLHEDFEADQNQNDAAGPFCPGFVACSKRGADLDSDHGNKKGGASDKGNCRKNPYFQKCEGDADRQRVDACCDGEQQHGPHIHRRVAGFGVLFQGFFDHVKANDAKQDERNPVVIGFDGTLKADAKQVAKP